MRIISPFRDYYDVVQKEGQDLSLIYLREPKELALKSFPFANWYNYKSYWRSDFSIHAFTIGFCGKIYPVFKMYEFSNCITKVCFTLEDCEIYLDEHLKEKKEKVRQRFYAEFRRFFEAVKQKSDDSFKSYFEDNRAPIFVATVDGSTNWSWQTSKSKIIFNTSLKEYEFYRIFDPYQAYQEINMWLSNQALPEKPIPEIDDKTMSEIKGFDKFSFRKDKSKK